MTLPLGTAHYMQVGSIENTFRVPEFEVIAGEPNLVVSTRCRVIGAPTPLTRTQGRAQAVVETLVLWSVGVSSALG